MMALSLLVLVTLSHPDALGQEDADTGSPAAEEEASGAAPGEELARRLDAVEAGPERKRRRRPRPAAAEEDAVDPRLLLGLVGLLLLWLLARSPSARRAEPQRPTRSSPMSHEELGRLLFMAARAADFNAYRDLYLNGPEAARILGVERAEAYLNQRSGELLEDALAELAAFIPPDAVYDGVKPVKGMLAVLARAPDGTVATIPAGTVTEVDGVQRLVHPPPDVDDEQRFGRRRTNF